MNKNIISDTLLNYNKQAIMELTRGNYDKALQLFKQSYFIENEMNFLKEKAKTLVNISNTEMLLNQPEKSLESSAEALIIFEKMGYSEDYIRTLLLMGKIYLFLKNTKKAEEAIYEVVQKSNIDEIKGEAYYSLYNIYIEDKNNYKAQESITKSIQHFERSKKNESLKQALQKRAEFFKGLKRNDLASMDLNKIKSLDNSMGL